jgi:hypothetical protein
LSTLQGVSGLSVKWLLAVGISHALHSAQMLDLATGKRGAEIVVPTARALYEQMLELLVEVEGDLTTCQQLEAKVHRRFWKHAVMVGNTALRAKQQRAMVSALQKVGRWEENCAICLEELDVSGDIEVVECLHSFHPKCVNGILKSARADVEECADGQGGAPVGTDISCRVDCPLCRMPLSVFAKFSEPDAQ